MLRKPPPPPKTDFAPQKTDLHFPLRATTFGDSGGRCVRWGRPHRRHRLINERLFILDLFCFPLSCLANRLRARAPDVFSILASGGRVDGQIVEMIIFQKQSAAAPALLWKTSACVCGGGVVWSQMESSRSSRSSSSGCGDGAQMAL